MLNKITQPGRSSARGFTLIELIMTIIILGLSTMILVPFFQAITQSPDPMMRQQSISLGQAMVNEILAKRWDENTPVGGGPVTTGESARGPGVATWPIADEEGGVRADFDDVDDYDGLTETNTFEDQTGPPSFPLAGFSRSVTVDYIASNSNPIDKNNPAAAAGATTDTKRIRVTVTTPLGEAFTFVAVSCNI